MSVKTYEIQQPLFECLQDIYNEKKPEDIVRLNFLYKYLMAKNVLFTIDSKNRYIQLHTTLHENILKRIKKLNFLVDEERRIFL
jgi:hypothetical protein